MRTLQQCPTCRDRKRLWLGGDDYLECPTCGDGTEKCGTCGGHGQIMVLGGRLLDCPDCEGRGVRPPKRTYIMAASLKLVRA